ncbi:hypothetical protein ACHAXA_006815 [Cyclostephanos tholiformis]|uniref:Vacuolar protein sorting-associated protein 29 n=1 Tax=Cyclostephanos tholiformis TaxID=382380 RepID=A0ABD3RR12_9STRA
MSSTSFGELVLVVGDHHIPMRAQSIPSQFRKMLVPGKVQRVLCTGNIGCYEEYDRLRTLVGGNSSNVHCVVGRYDFAYPTSSAFSSSSPPPPPLPPSSAKMMHMPSFPETKVVQLGNFRVGIIGGHQVVPWGDMFALSMVRRRLGVDVLISGNRRKEGIVEYEGGHYLFPGSITGAYDACTPNVNPSFILLAVQGSKIVCYVYELRNGEVDVSKTEFTKE